MASSNEMDIYFDNLEDLNDQEIMELNRIEAGFSQLQLTRCVPPVHPDKLFPIDGPFSSVIEPLQHLSLIPMMIIF
jgi:hypothetical protein